MLPLARILLPIDFSDRCLAMLPYARAIAAHYHAELILLHVETDAELTKAAKDRLQDLHVRRVLYEGDPADVIVGLTKAEKIDLIVMPTHGYSVFRRFLIGSVTAKVLHDVACPVLTGVHMEEQAAAKPTMFSDVLCAIDLGPQSLDVLKWAWQIATGFHVPLGVLHAVLPLGSAGDLPFAGEWRAEATIRSRQAVEKLLNESGAGPATVYIEEGEAAKTVCSFAKEAGAGLLVIGRGPKDRMNGRLTTQAYAIIRQSPCLVLSI